MSRESSTPSEPDVIVFDFVRSEVRRVSQAEANEGVKANCRDHGHIFATAGCEPATGDLCICGEAKFEDVYPRGL